MIAAEAAYVDPFDRICHGLRPARPPSAQREGREAARNYRPA